MYGLFNWFSLGDFVVPLPISFVFAAIIPLVFIFTTKPSYHSLLYLTIPLLLFKDLVIYDNEAIGIGFIITSVIALTSLGIIILKQYYQQTLIRFNGLLLISTPILLIGNNKLSILLIALTTFTTYRTLQAEQVQQVSLERSLLITLFIHSLFLLNETSNWLVRL
jgi:hypothetical protein